MAEVESGKAGGKEDDSDGGNGNGHIAFLEVVEPVECIGADLSVAVTGIVYGAHKGIFKSDTECSSETCKAALAFSASYGILGALDDVACERAVCGTRKANHVIDSCTVPSKGSKEHSVKDFEAPDFKKHSVAGCEHAKEHAKSKTSARGSNGKVQTRNLYNTVVGVDASWDACLCPPLYKR